MKECLKCGKEFQEKKPTAKYCSTSCRVLYNRNREKKVEKFQGKVVLNQIMEAMDDFREMIKTANINYAPANTDTYKGSNLSKTWVDELGQFGQPKNKQPTFQELLNGMVNVHFSDDKEDYADKIRAATHLSEKEIKLLLTNLWAKN